MTKRIRPKPGALYTAEQILNDLDLDDTPHWQFHHEGKLCVVQDAHLTRQELLSVPGFAETTWTYIRTTSEWIPLFTATSASAVRDCVDIEPRIDPYLDDAGFWVTPKGFQRAQYYKRNADGEVVRYDGEPVARLTNQRL